MRHFDAHAYRTEDADGRVGLRPRLHAHLPDPRREGRGASARTRRSRRRWPWPRRPSWPSRPRPAGWAATPSPRSAAGRYDVDALAAQGYGHERLDQLVDRAAARRPLTPPDGRSSPASTLDAVHQGRGARRRHRRAGGVGPGARTRRRRRRAASRTRRRGGRPSSRRGPRPALADRAAPSPSAASSTGWSCSTPPASVVRPAKLWNDTESAPDAGWLLKQLPAAPRGGPRRAARVPVAAFTITKLAWLAPQRARRRGTAWRTVLLPHDWLTHRLTGAFVTDRGDASGTGYWSPAAGDVPAATCSAIVDERPRLVAAPCPRCSGPADGRRRRGGGAVVGPGTGDNMAAALGLGLAAGRRRHLDRHVGHRLRRQRHADGRPDGRRGRLRRRHRPLPAPRVHPQRHEGDRRRRPAPRRRPRPASTRLALAAPPGAGGLVLLPYLDGERTPNRPDATGVARRPALRRRRASSWPGPRSRAWCAACSTASTPSTRPGPDAAGRLLLVGGGAESAAYRPDPRRPGRPARARAGRATSWWPPAPRVQAAAVLGGARRRRRWPPRGPRPPVEAVEPGPGRGARRRGARRLRHPARRRGVSDPFEVLGLPATATLDEVRAARRRLARAAHPDVGGDERRMREINQAFDQAVRRLLGRPDRSDPPAPGPRRRLAPHRPSPPRPPSDPAPGRRRGPWVAARRAVVHHRRAAGRRLRRPRAGGRRARRDPGRGPALPARGAAAAAGAVLVPPRAAARGGGHDGDDDGGGDPARASAVGGGRARHLDRGAEPSLMRRRGWSPTDDSLRACQVRRAAALRRRADECGLPSGASRRRRGAASARRRIDAAPRLCAGAR